MSKKEVQEALDSLHTALATELLKRVKAGTATASDLSVARQFLKDNNIDSVPAEGTPIRDLALQVPFGEPDEADFKH